MLDFIDTLAAETLAAMSPESRVVAILRRITYVKDKKGAVRSVAITPGILQRCEEIRGSK